MKGFFSSAALTTSVALPLVPQCGSCGLYKTCQSPKMPVTGKGRKKILVLAEGPGKDEDSQGIQLCGASGQHLEKALAKFGIDMRRDCWLSNSIICRATNAAGSNRAPTEKEIGFCRPNLTKALQELRPRTIICLGECAVQSLIQPIFDDGGGYAIGRWAGWDIPCQKLNAWVCPTWHPAYLLREASPTLQLLWEGHLRKAADHAFGSTDPVLGDIKNLVDEACGEDGRPWKEPPDWPKSVDIILGDKEAAERIMLMTEVNDGALAFDYESTSLKPDSKDVGIFCCSISDGKKAIAYPWQGKAIRATESFLRSNVPKIGANVKFESRWTMAKLKIRVRNWWWDTMIAAHILDCRSGITGLKMQAYCNLGQGTYNSRVDSFLKAEGSNSRNRIGQADLNDVLRYCGLDSLLEYKLAMKQRKQMGYGD